MIDRREFRERDIRGWVGYAIRDGNSIEWASGWFVKILFEIVVAAIVGGLIFAAVDWQTPISDIGKYYGVESRNAILVLFIGGFYYQVFNCEFDREDDDVE